jgi:hypothetical protein
MDKYFRFPIKQINKIIRQGFPTWLSCKRREQLNLERSKRRSSKVGCKQKKQQRERGKWLPNFAATREKLFPSLFIFLILFLDFRSVMVGHNMKSNTEFDSSVDDRVAKNYEDDFM